jgi:sodium pump decarboxylase gamma subunit
VEDTLRGLYVTVVGMSLLFLALGLLMVFMNLLARAFPVKEEAEKPLETEPAASEATPAGTAGAADVAAIAVALALAERDRPTAPGAPPASGATPDPWILLGRQALMASRSRR